MAANLSYSGTTDDTLEFDRAVDHLNIGVGTGVTFSFSIDGENYVPLPVGFHSLRVGPTKKVFISATGGSWGLIAVQS